MIIRKATSEDMKEVHSLLCELEDEKLPFKNFAEVFTENLENSSVNYFVCENEDRILAFGSLHIQSLLHHCSRVAEIQELVVRREYKGTGIGKVMFRKMEETARTQNCSLIEVCCNKKRKQAHGFYEHCGMLKSHYKFTDRLG